MRFPLKFGGTTVVVRKVPPAAYTREHGSGLRAARLVDGMLQLPKPGWRSELLGMGEEKAVFVVADPHGGVVATELLDERHYCNGRLLDGHYFEDLRAPGCEGVDAQPGALIGLTFTGRIRVREFVYGYEWGRFHYRPGRLHRRDHLLTAWLQMRLAPQMEHYRAHYRDVHDRNVLFEIRPRGAAGVHIALRDWTGRMHIARVGLRPIDLR